MPGSTRLAAVAAAGLLIGAAMPATASAETVTQTNLVSNVPGVAKVLDKNLQNPWGIAFGPGDAFWFSDNNSGLSTLYDGQGNIVPLVVTVPAAPGQKTGTPSGIVANPTFGNPTPDFQVAVPDSSPATTVAAPFIFDSEDGTISAWAPSVGLTKAVTVVNNSAAGAVYKGLAFATASSGNHLYATNFRAGTVEAYDGSFKRATLPGSFTDREIPRGYAPFGIANIDGDLYVTYAKQDAAKHDDVPGAGHGFVDVFSADGVLLKRFATRGALDSPWGIVRAPFGFGKLGGKILIGNFGNGWINVFPASGGASTGSLMVKSGNALAIDGLWGLTTGTAANSDPEKIYFTAGPKHETNGLFGSLAAD